MLVNTRLVVREPRRQGSGDMVDDLVRLGARAWAPPLPIMGRGGDGTVREKRGLHVVGKTCQGLSGIRFTGKGRAAQRLEGFDFVGTLLEPLLVDSALGLRLARLGVDEHPALRDTPIARGHDVIAIALRQRRHRWGIGLGQDGLGFTQGCGDTGDPLQTRLGELLQVLCTIEGTVGHQERRAIGGLQLGHMVGDDLAKVVRVTTIATEGLHQHGNTGLVFHNQVQHHLVEVRALIPTVATGDVNDVCLRFLVTVIAAIDMEARPIEMGERGCQAQTLGRRGGNEAVEFGHAQRRTAYRERARACHR